MKSPKPLNPKPLNPKPHSKPKCTTGPLNEANGLGRVGEHSAGQQRPFRRRHHGKAE